MLTQFPFLIVPMTFYMLLQLRIINLGSIDPWSVPIIYVPGFGGQVLRLDMQDALVLMVLLSVTLELVRAVRFLNFNFIGAVFSGLVFAIGLTTLLFGEFAFNSALFTVVFACAIDSVTKFWLWRTWRYASLENGRDMQ